MPRSKDKRSRRFVIVINNYTEELFTQIHTKLRGQKNVKHYILGKEVGEEKKTPHIQGFIEFNSGVYFSKMKKDYPTAHIESAKGTLKANFDYCSKENNYVTNIDLRSAKDKLRDMVLEDEYKDVYWYNWQNEIINMVSEKPDKRKIFWYWEKDGNIGKSYLCKYLALKFDVIIAEGKKDNIFNQVNKALEEGKLPKVILLDIPRTVNDYVNYGAIEQLKNGMMYSGKYEGGQCIFPIPHVICFSNEEPNYTAMSRDRWSVTELQQ